MIFLKIFKCCIYSNASWINYVVYVYMSGFVENLDVPYIPPIILLYSVYFF